MCKKHIFFIYGNFYILFCGTNQIFAFDDDHSWNSSLFIEQAFSHLCVKSSIMRVRSRGISDFNFSPESSVGCKSLASKGVWSREVLNIGNRTAV